MPDSAQVPVHVVSSASAWRISLAQRNPLRDAAEMVATVMFLAAVALLEPSMLWFASVCVIAVLGFLVVDRYLLIRSLKTDEDLVCAGYTDDRFVPALEQTTGAKVYSGEHLSYAQLTIVPGGLRLGLEVRRLEKTETMIPKLPHNSARRYVQRRVRALDTTETVWRLVATRRGRVVGAELIGSGQTSSLQHVCGRLGRHVPSF